MDENKLKVLKTIEYKAQPCCALCEYGIFKLNQDFGICVKHFYMHRKHTEEQRWLSVNKNGICNNPGFMKDVNTEFFGKINE